MTLKLAEISTKITTFAEELVIYFQLKKWKYMIDERLSVG